MPIGITLDWDRCPDGVEIHDYGSGKPGPSLLSGQPTGLYVRPRSVRVETLHLCLEDIADTLVLKLVSAASDDDLLAFMSTYGILNVFSGRGGATGIDEAPLDDAIRLRNNLRRTLALKGHDDPMAVVNLFNQIASGPSLHLEMRPRPSGHPPVLSMRPSSLYGFIVTETALILSHDAQIRTCAHCGTPFMVGAASGKKANSVYCTPRCRLAAFRAARAPK